MATLCQVRITDHFRRNLEDIEAFLRKARTISAFDELLDDLTSTVIPNLERFPEMGRDFLARVPGSVEAAQGMDRLRAFRGYNLREYVLPPYLVLYARTNRVVDLLSIRHHRQLSFDFAGLWDD